MADYLPKTDDALVAWFDNFQVKFIGYSTALGMGALQESVQADFGNLQYVVALADRYWAEAKERTAYKSEVRLRCVKKTLDGVLVEFQRATETVWVQIGMDTSSPYLDSREPLVVGVPELRRYRLRYVKTDEPIGDYSDVVTVTTVP